MKTCYNCKQTGKIISDENKCHKCRGEGLIDVKKQLNRSNISTEKYINYAENFITKTSDRINRIEKKKNIKKGKNQQFA